MKSAFYHIQRAYNDSFSYNINESIALVGSGTIGGHGRTRGGRRRGKGCSDFGGYGDPDEGNYVVSCFYYKEAAHIKMF